MIRVQQLSADMAYLHSSVYTVLLHVLSQIYGTCDGGSHRRADSRAYYVDELLAPYVVQDSISEASSIVSGFYCTFST
jgi:hypothetical protein